MTRVSSMTSYAHGGVTWHGESKEISPPSHFLHGIRFAKLMQEGKCVWEQNAWRRNGGRPNVLRRNIYIYIIFGANVPGGKEIRCIGGEIRNVEKRCSSCHAAEDAQRTRIFCTGLVTMMYSIIWVFFVYNECTNGTATAFSPKIISVLGRLPLGRFPICGYLPTPAFGSMRVSANWFQESANNWTFWLSRCGHDHRPEDST